MKSVFSFLVFFLVFLFICSSFAVAETEYKAFLFLNEDASIHIKERFTFSDDVPFIRFLARETPDALSVLHYDDFSLKKNGVKIPVKISYVGNYLRLFSSEPGLVGNGRYAVYDLSYVVRGAVYQGENKDTFAVTILNAEDIKKMYPLKAEATVIVPKGIQIISLLSLENVISRISENYAFFQFTGNNTFFSVGLLFSKGLNITRNIYRDPLKESRLMLLVIFSFYLFWWLCLGKDDDIGKIIPLSDPVHGLTMGKAASVFFGKFVDVPNAIAASLLTLAQKRHLNILRDRNKNIYLEKISNISSSIEDSEERKMFNLFFAKNDKVLLSLGENMIKAEDASFFASIFSAYAASLHKFSSRLIEKNTWVVFVGVLLHLVLSVYFLIVSAYHVCQMSALVALTVPFVIKIDKRLRLGFYFKATAGFIFLFFFFIVAAYFYYAVTFLEDFYVPASNMIFVYSLFVLMVILSVFLHVIFYYLMDHPNSASVRLLNRLGCTNEYITENHVERDVIPNPEIFEANLPFAVIFNKSGKWQRDFSIGYFDYRPDWAKGIWDEAFVEDFVTAIRQLYKNSGF